MAVPTLKAQAAADAALYLDSGLPWGVEVTYNGSPIDAGISYREEQDESSGATMTVAELVVQTADVADPGYRDSVVIGSTTWRVRQVINGDDSCWRLLLYSDERPAWR